MGYQQSRWAFLLKTAPYWKPIEVPWCHAGCPLSVIIPLNGTCRARDEYIETDGKIDLCPFHNGRFERMWNYIIDEDALVEKKLEEVIDDN